MALIDESVAKLPPQSLEAEQSVLGAILLDNHSLNKSVEILAQDDFYREAHRRIFRGMLDLSERNEAIDLITLAEHLKQQNVLEEIGGVGYLASLVQAIPTAANIQYHSKIVHEKGVLRELIQVSTEIVTQGLEGGRNADELLDQAEQKIFSISQASHRRSFVPLKDAVTSGIHLIDELFSKKSEITGIPSGFIDLDGKT
ncbi:MAG TPA: replicative DNA helicase, partial [Nitrospirales bacterium]|nr:replicative DNA helicase [Nitrospirales bacterium]